MQDDDNKPFDPHIALEQMRSYVHQPNSSTDEEHIEADSLMSRLLRYVANIGLGEEMQATVIAVADAYDDLEVWYV